MLRIITACTFICLTACEKTNNNDVTQENISSEKLTGTWIYDDSNDIQKTFHLIGSEDSILKTDCYGEELYFINNQNNMLVGESGIEFWNIKDTDNLYRGDLVAVKLDNENSLSFGSISVAIGESDLSVLNSKIDTTNYCSELNKDIINIYVKDNSDIQIKLSLTNTNMIGSNSVELGELLTQFIWKDRANTTHIEWLDSGTLNCSFSTDNNLNCNLEGVLALSGSLLVDFTILEKHLPSDINQSLP